MADLERLDHIRQALEDVYNAISTTSLQAKPAILGLLNRAHDEAGAIMRKGARGAIKLGAAGAYGRKHLELEFIQRLIELAGAATAADADASAESGADQGEAAAAAGLEPATNQGPPGAPNEG